MASLAGLPLAHAQAPAGDKPAAAPAKPPAPTPAPAAPAAPGAAAAAPDAKKADPKSAAPAAAPKSAAPKADATKAGAATGVGATIGAGAATAAKPKEPDKKTRDAARKAYGEGEKAFNSGDFPGALEGFRKADALIPSPHAQYWTAKSLDKLDRVEESIAAYQRYLENPDANRAGAEKVTDAENRVSELRLKLIAQVEVVTVPAGASVSVDGNPEPGVTPLALKLAPGAHKITLSATGYEPKEINLDAKAGDKIEQRHELALKPPPAPPPAPIAEAPATPPPPPPPPEKRSMVPAFVTLGIAGASAIVGTVFGVQALSARSKFKDKPTTSNADDTERNALISDMAFGVAITLGVTGVVLLTSGDEPQETARTTPPKLKLEFDGYASKQAGGASARLRF
ncbi:MAG TPA: PEGA domain-containing protein [Polyangiaceae bacterium]|nr:PEGA domain-containing protein [Polyangiaceae bacterium]